MHWEPGGAFTGEISAGMLQALRVKHVVIGHSERRQWFGESDAIVAKKARGEQERRDHPGLHGRRRVCVGLGAKGHGARRDRDRRARSSRRRALSDLRRAAHRPLLARQARPVVKAHGEGARFYLVFHGGSGSALSEIHEALDYGGVKRLLLKRA
jgi:hypothetical protein